MRVRTIGLSALALGILIGAGGCSSESPTSSLAPASASTQQKGGFIGSGKESPASVSGGFIGSGRRDTTTATISGGFIGSGY
ncbi:MAG TPA: hypothetical protein VF710_22095 [Longimicrobium sp.]|jgi:hypothetical protein